MRVTRHLNTFPPYIVQIDFDEFGPSDGYIYLVKGCSAAMDREGENPVGEMNLNKG